MVELLSPVGNIKTLYYAIANGADAVYLAGKNFGARANAINFTNEELIEAINFSHLHGVKVYVTVNTIVYEDEVDELIKFVKFLYLNNVDALIMQDLGMIKLVRELYPNLEIHASTQCHIHNKETALALKELGVKRVVFARELDLNTIKNMDIDVEKEIFIHGALCVSYSGCCLFSSLNGGRSANRGLCVGSCRLPYKLIENNKVIKTDGKYLLSMRELNTINNLDKILDSDIKCLKIEGRMKGYEYVGYITKMYREAIDNYYKNKNIKIDSNKLNNMNTLYNRKTTNGYLFDDKVININSSNHIGTYLGDVISVNNKIIKIKLVNTLNQGDGIRFTKTNLGMIVNKLYKNNKLISKADKYDIIEIDNKINLTSKDTVNKTSSIAIKNEIDKLIYKKVAINIKVIAKINKPLIIEFSDGINKVEATYDIVDKAINRSTTEDQIKEKLSKLGTSIYTLNNIEIVKDDNIFINMSIINNARRDLVEKLNNKRISKNTNIIINKYNKIKVNNKPCSKININVLVRNEEQLNYCLNNSYINDIYVTDYNLYEKYKSNNHIYYQEERINPKLMDIKNENILATELSSIMHYTKNNNVVSDYCLNVVNNKTIDYLNNMNVKRITLSLELDDNILKLLNHQNTEIIIYGRATLMLTKYSVLKENINNFHKSNNNKYYLEDRLDYRFPIIDNTFSTSIMDAKIINNIAKLSTYKNIGIKNYRLELFDENSKDIENIINKIQNYL